MNLSPLQAAMRETDRAEMLAAAEAEIDAGVAHAVEAVAHSTAIAGLASKPDEEQLRQRNLDAALADIVEVTSRHRARLGRRVCSRNDGALIRQMFDLLRGMSSSADSDPSFQ